MLRMPNKIQNFLWRICDAAILVGLLLWKKRIVKSPICVLCNSANESIKHMIFECEWTRAVWFVCCSGLKINKEKISSFNVWWLNMYKDLKEKDCVMMMNNIAYVCWKIWKIKCEMVIEKKSISVNVAIM